jgi:hypothetical protein
MPFTGVPATDRSEADTVQCIRKRITFSVPGSGTNLTVGVLPAGAAVVGGGILVLTLFNSSGTDLMDVGATTLAGTNTVQVFASAVDVSAVGLKALDDLTASSANNYSDTEERTVTAKYTGSVVDATTGTADIMIFYVTKPVT